MRCKYILPIQNKKKEKKITDTYIHIIISPLSYIIYLLSNIFIILFPDSILNKEEVEEKEEEERNKTFSSPTSNEPSARRAVNLKQKYNNNDVNSDNNNNK
jgi:hypothetical protein